MHLLSLVLVIADQKNAPFLWKFLQVYKFLRTGPDRWWGTTVCPWSANSRWGKAANHGRFSSIQYAKDLSFEEFLRKFGKVFGQRISKKFEKYSGNICQENPKKSWNSWRKNVERALEGHALGTGHQHTSKRTASCCMMSCHPSSKWERIINSEHHRIYT